MLTHSGSTYSGNREAISRLVVGTTSLGLMMAQLPAAIAPTKRHQHELERVVPGPDDQDDAHGLRVDPACAGLADQ